MSWCVNDQPHSLHQIRLHEWFLGEGGAHWRVGLGRPDAEDAGKGRAAQVKGVADWELWVVCIKPNLIYTQLL